MGGPPRLAVEENLVEAYTWPIGIVSRWFRAVAVGSPGSFLGWGSAHFPPRHLFFNDLARERRTARVELVYIDGRDYLLCKAPKPNVGIIRATTADEL